MANSYLHLLIFVLISGAIGLIAVLLPSILGPTRKNKQKLEPYESGIIPFAARDENSPSNITSSPCCLSCSTLKSSLCIPGLVLPIARRLFCMAGAIAMGFSCSFDRGSDLRMEKGALDWE